jgi:hypothetical protein
MAVPLRMGCADLHIHPSGDAVRVTTPRAVYAALRVSALHVAVLADHDRIEVAQALVARSLEEGIAVELVVGEEISTREGHLLGINLSALVPAGLSLAETVAAVHAQGALAVVAHPLLPPYLAASPRRLIDLAEGDPGCRPDALETMNPVAAWIPGWRHRVERLAARCGYATVGGSDAHVARAVGRGLTYFRGASAVDLLAAIRGCETRADGRRAPLRDVLRRARD